MRAATLIRGLALAAGLFLPLLVSGPAAAFGDCSAPGYLASVEERMEGLAVDCTEVDRFRIETPKGGRQVRIVRTSELPTTDIPVLVREIRRGIEQSAARLSSVGAFAPADITIWISHLLPEPAADDEELDEVDGQIVGADDGCRMALYPASTGRRGLAITAAHEFFHCVQASEFPDTYDRASSSWWVEGTAEWFANLVFPGTATSDGFVSEFDSVSHDTALTAMEYESVVFFFWLGERQGSGAIGRLMRAVQQPGEPAQQDALAAFLPAEEWQDFAEAYLSRRIRQPGGRAIASSPFPGDIYVWGEGSHSHEISARRFILARAQLEFGCGVWSVGEQSVAGTRAYREGSGSWQEELPERIVSDGGTPRVFQMAGFGTGPEGFSLRIEAFKDACQGCPATAAATGSLDQCLIGTWELVSGGYGAMIEEQLRQTGIFEHIDYPDLHRHFVLEPNGRYRQSPSEGGESGSMSERTPEGKLWQGFSNLRLETEGSWSADGNVLQLCEEQKSVSVDLTVIDPKGREERLDQDHEVTGTLSLLRSREYECSGNSLSLIEALPGAPAVRWEYRRQQ